MYMLIMYLGVRKALYFMPKVSYISHFLNSKCQHGLGTTNNILHSRPESTFCIFKFWIVPNVIQIHILQHNNSTLT